MTQDFKWRHFRGEIFPWAERSCRRHGVGCRDLEEMLEERGVAEDHTTIGPTRIRGVSPLTGLVSGLRWQSRKCVR